MDHFHTHTLATDLSFCQLPSFSRPWSMEESHKMHHRNQTITRHLKSAILQYKFAFCHFGNLILVGHWRADFFHKRDTERGRERGINVSPNFERKTWSDSQYMHKRHLIHNHLLSVIQEQIMQIGHSTFWMSNSSQSFAFCHQRSNYVDRTLHTFNVRQPATISCHQETNYADRTLHTFNVQQLTIICFLSSKNKLCRELSLSCWQVSREQNWEKRPGDYQLLRQTHSALQNGDRQMENLVMLMMIRWPAGPWTSRAVCPHSL